MGWAERWAGHCVSCSSVIALPVCHGSKFASTGVKVNRALPTMRVSSEKLKQSDTCQGGEIWVELH